MSKFQFPARKPEQSSGAAPKYGDFSSFKLVGAEELEEKGKGLELIQVLMVDEPHTSSPNGAQEVTKVLNVPKFLFGKKKKGIGKKDKEEAESKKVKELKEANLSLAERIKEDTAKIEALEAELASRPEIVPETATLLEQLKDANTKLGKVKEKVGDAMWNLIFPPDPQNETAEPSNGAAQSIA